MARQANRHGIGWALLSPVLGLALAAGARPAAAWNAPSFEQDPQPPSSSPSTQEALEKLKAIKEKMDKDGAPAPAAQPPAGERTIEAAREAAKPNANTQRGPAPARDDFVGPPARRTGAPPVAAQPPGARPLTPEGETRSDAVDHAAAPPPGQPGAAPAADDFVGPPARRGATAGAPQPDGAQPGAVPAADDFVGPPARRGSVAGTPADTQNGKPATPENGAGHRPDRPSGAAGHAPRDVESKQTDDTEWFAFNNTPWEDVIALFVERLGKPLMSFDDAAVIGGTLTYQSQRKFTKDEALDELNLILHMKGYRFVEREYHLYLVPLAEMPQYVDPKFIYENTERFEEAHPRDTDYVQVYVRAAGRPAQQYIDLFGDALPDYSRLSALSDSNQIKVTALAKDVRKFIALSQRIDLSTKDPREFEIVEIQTNAQAIVQLVQEILGIGSVASRLPAGRPRMVRDPNTGQLVPAAPAPGASDEGEIRMIADQRTNTIILKGTRDKIDEVKKLVKDIDKRPDIGDFKTYVREIEYANAVDVKSTLEQIFQQEQGAQSNIPAWQRAAAARRPVPNPQNPNQPPVAANTPEGVLLESDFEKAKKTIRLAADERTNALIVYANDEGLKRVDEMLKIIDKSVPKNFKTIKLQHAQAGELFDTINQIVQNMSQFGGAAPRGGAVRKPTVVPDELNNALYVMAEREDMGNIEQVIAQLDVEPDDPRTRHVVQLANITASAAAQLVSDLLSTRNGGTAGAAGPGRNPGGFRPGGMAPRVPTATIGTAQIIPLDASQTLIVVCSDQDWEKVEPLLLDQDAKALTDTPVMEQFAVAQGDPQAIANTLSAFYGNYRHPVLGQQRTAFAVEGRTIFVQGVRPAIEEIAALIASLDVPSSSRLVILPLVSADAAQVEAMVQPIVQSAGGAVAMRGGGGVMSGSRDAVFAKAEPITNSLIVQADPDTLKQIEDFAAAYDDRVASEKPEQRFFALKNADPQQVASTVSQMFAGAQGGGGRFAGRATGGQVRAWPAPNSDQIIVEAPKDRFAEIEATIAKIDDPGGRDVIIKTVQMPGADVNAVANNLTQAFEAKRRLFPNMVAQFRPDAMSETILLTCNKDALDEAEKLLAEFKELSKLQIREVQFRQVKNVVAQDAANWLRDQLQAFLAPQLGRSVAAQVSVTFQAESNRVIINGPQIAVTKGLQLLDIFDVAPDAALDVQRVLTENVKLPGMDVANIAGMLQQSFDAEPPRPDRLRFRFTADRMSEQIVYTVPRDAMERVKALIDKLLADQADFKQQQKFIKINVADADYVKNQLNEILNVQVSRRFGADVAGRVSVTVDQRLNQIIVSAPKIAVDMADAIIAQLDVASERESPIQTITLENANAADMVQILQRLFEEKIRTNRNLKISAEPMTNSIIFAAGKEDGAEIRKWAEDLDTKSALVTTEMKVFEVGDNDPTQVRDVLTQQFGSRGRGPAVPGRETSFSVMGSSIVAVAPAIKMTQISEAITTLDAAAESAAGAPVAIELEHADANQVRSVLTAMFSPRGRQASPGEAVSVEVSGSRLVVQAPPKKMEDIRALVAELDKEAPSLDFHVYTLKQLDATLVQMGVSSFLRGQGAPRGGGMQPTAIAEPTTNSLVVFADKSIMPMIDLLVSKLDGAELPTAAVARTHKLKIARADEIAQSVEAMLQSKAQERQIGMRKGSQPRVVSVPRANQLIVFAPDEMQELAEDIIRMVDAEDQAGEVVHIIQLERGDAEALARTITDVMQPAGGARGAAGSVKATADKASNSVVLKGLIKDVAEAEQYLGLLEKGSDAIPELQIFRIENGDITAISETLANIFAADKTVTVTADDYSSKLYVTAGRRTMRKLEGYVKLLDEAPPMDEGDLYNGKELHFVTITRGDASDIAWDVRDMFPDEDKGGPSIDADWYGEYIKVMCRPGEFARIEKVIREYESRAKIENTLKRIKPKADTAALLAYLRQQRSDIQVINAEQTPKEESLIIELTPEGEKPRRPTRGRSGTTNGGESGAIRKAADPFQVGVAVTDKLLSDIEHDLTQPRAARLASAAQDEAGPPALKTPAAQPRPAERKPAPKPAPSSPLDPDDDADLNEPAAAAPKAQTPDKPAVASARQPAAQPVAKQPAATPPAGGDSSATPPEPKRDPVKVIVQPDSTIVLEGDKDRVADIEAAIDLLTEDMDVGEVIRIFHFRYGDVTAAAQIMRQMFDVPNQRIPQQLLQQQMQQQQQQQQQRRGGRGEEGGDEKGGANAGGNMMDQLRSMVGGGRGAAGASGKQAAQMRIATDAGHSYLIVKCEASLLPEIQKLLQELDIPPGEVDVRVFQLKTLDAAETAENVKEVLGISRARGGRQPGFPNIPGGQGRNPQQQQMLEIMQQQQMFMLPGMEDGTKVESVEIVANDVTNSLLVSAPPDVMTLVESVITKLEGLEAGNSIVIRHYELKRAKVEDVLPLLQAVFGAAGGRGGGGITVGGEGGPAAMFGGGRRQGGGRSRVQGQVGQVTFSSDPRVNTLIVTCEAKDIPLIEEQIERFDLEGPLADADIFQCEFGDAEAIATVVETIYGEARRGGGAGEGPGGRAGAAASSATAVRIEPEPTTNTIVVWGPPDKRDLILKKIADLEQRAAKGVITREIPVLYADPEKLADKLLSIVVGGSSGGGAAAAFGDAAGGRRRGRSGGATSGRVSIIGDKAAKKLFVRAPQGVYTQIEDLVAALDQESQEMGIERFELRYAKAEEVVESVKQAMQEYISVQRLLGGGQGDLGVDPFVPVADPRTNSVVVVGSPQTFAVVRKLLSVIDTETPAGERKEFRVFSLVEADAETVASAINSFAGAGQTGAQPGGGMGGGMGGGGRRGGVGALPNRSGAGAGGRELDVTATAEPTTNSVLVFGRPEDIDLVESSVIAQLEKNSQTQIAMIPVENVPASQVFGYLSNFLEQRGAARQGRGGGPADGKREAMIQPNDTGKSIIVRGTKAQIDEVRDLVAQFDSPDYVVANAKIIEVPLGQDVEALAAMIEQVLNQGEESLARANNREPRRITVGANVPTRTLVVYGDPSIFGTAETLVKQLAEINPAKPETRVFRLRNLSAQDALQLIEDLRNPGSRSGGGARPVIGGGRSNLGGGANVRPGGASPNRTPRSGGTNTRRPTGTPPGAGRPTIAPPANRPAGQPSGQPGGAPRRVQPRGPQPGGAPPGGGGGGGGGTPRDEFGYAGGSRLIVAAGPLSPFIAYGIFDELRKLGGAEQPPVPAEPEVQQPEPVQEQSDVTSEPATIRPIGWIGSHVSPGPFSALAVLFDDEGAAPPPPAPEAPKERPPARPKDEPRTPTTRKAPRPADAGAAPRDARKAEPAAKRAAQPPASKPASKPARRPVAAPVDDSSAPERPFGRERLSAAADQLADEMAASAPASAPSGSVTGVTGVSGSLKGDVLATPYGSDQVIITGDAEDLEFIERILSLMEGTAPAPVLQIFQLSNAKAGTLAPIIESQMEALIAVRTATPGPGDRFSIIAETRSNSLIVVASKENVETIAEIIDTLDVDTIGGTRKEIVRLENSRAADVVAQLQPIIDKIQDISEVEQAARPFIQALDRLNAVAIVGTDRDIAEIEELVREYDIKVEIDDTGDYSVAEIVLMPLRNAQATDVAKVLDDMIKEQQEAANAAVSGGGGNARASVPFVRKLRLRLADGTELPELDLERPIRILPEKGTNSLIMFSSKKNIEPLQQIAQVFDTLPIGADTDVRVFALKHASAENVQKLLQDVFDKGKKPLLRPSDSGDNFEKGVLPPVPPDRVAAQGLPYEVSVQFDARSNVVVVIGRKESVLLAAGLVAEIDKPASELGVKSYVLSLKNMNAKTAAESLTDVMEKRAQALGDKNEARDGAIITPEERSNALIIVASESVYDMLENLAMQLDSSGAFRPVETRYRHVKTADAARLQGMLQDLFDKKKEAEGNINESKETLHVIADPRSNSLLLTGTRDYLNEADRLVESLDQDFDPTMQIKLRKVLLNSASNIATLLQDLVDKTKQEGGDTKLTGTPIHIAADAVSNSLLLAASAEDMVKIEKWVDILDRPSEVTRRVAIIPLKNQNAEQISDAVQNLFTGGGRAGRAGGGGAAGGANATQVDVTVTFEEKTNSVVAYGPNSLLQDVVALVKQLDETTSVGGRIVRIFPLDQADAETAVDLIESILTGRGGAVGGRTTGGGGAGGGGTADRVSAPLLLLQKQNPQIGTETLRAMAADIQVIGDTRTNSIVVTAPMESMPLVESLVEAIDTKPKSDTVRVFQLRNGDAEQMVTLLQDLFDTSTSGTGGGGGGRTATTTTGTEERTLTLGEGPSSGGRQQIYFAAEPRTNSVIAAGTSGYLDLVERLILELDTKPIEERRTVIYAPRNIPAADMATSLTDYSQKEKDRLEALGDDVSLQRKQEREIVAIANESANRVIVSFSPRFESSVMDVIKELDQQPPQVLIQILIVEVTLDNSLDLGVEFAFQDLQFQKAGPTDTTTFDYVGGTDIGAAGSGLGGFSFTISGKDFNFLLRTLQNEGSLNVLNRPQIVAMDNKPASFEVTDDVPYVNSTSTTTGGQITTSVSRERVGITLTVTPQINPDGWVRMEIRQEASEFSGSTVDVGQGITAPVFLRRIAETNVQVKDNETIVLGGLVRTREERREQKVPLVGDIPFLGTLFRNQSHTTNRSELLVILTPHVIRSIEDYRELSATERDRTGIIPPDVLTSPLMQGLQVKPDNLIIDGQPRPDLKPVTPREEDEPDDGGPANEQYGPSKPAAMLERVRKELNGTADPNSYDVPLPTLAGRSP